MTLPSQVYGGSPTSGGMEEVDRCDAILSVLGTIPSGSPVVFLETNGKLIGRKFRRSLRRWRTFISPFGFNQSDSCQNIVPLRAK